MNKKIRKQILGFLIISLIFCLVCLFVGYYEANATNTTRLNLQTEDENYYFTNGASVYIPELTEESGSMKFRFNVMSPSLEDLQGQLGESSTWWGAVTDSYYCYTFTIYKYLGINEDDANLISVMPLVSERIILKYLNHGGDIIKIGAEKKHSYYSEDIVFSQNQAVGLELNSYEKSDIDEKIKDEGYTEYWCAKVNYNYGLVTDNGGLDLVISNISPYTKYFIRAEIEVNKCTSGGGIFGQGITYDLKKQQCDSAIRSISDILTNMYEAGALERELGSKLSIGQSIISSDHVERVKVRLLQQIGETPFAMPVYRYVNVPVVSHKIFYSDLISLFDTDSLNCLGSNAYGCEYDSVNNTYNIYYLENVWTRSITTDGNFYDYFLNINKSYRDFYYPFVVDGIISQEMYEWVFSSKLLNLYPELAGFQFDEVFGYFGFIVVPEAHTYNSMLVEMFGIDTNIVGAIKNFSFEDNIDYSSYMKLLDDYNYTWLTKAWEDIAGGLLSYPATFYIIYSEPGTESSFIAEGGQTDAENPDSALTENVIEPVVETVGSIFENEDFLMWFFVGVAGLIAIVIIIVVIKHKKE